MKHGFDSFGKLEKPAYQTTIGLTSHAPDYVFQGSMKEIKGYMEGRGANLKLKVSLDTNYAAHNWHYLIVDISDVAPKAATAYLQAVVAATPGVNVLGALMTAFGSKKIIVRLRYGFTAPPEKTTYTRLHIELPATGTRLANLAAALDGSRKIAAVKVANIGVSIAKTVVKILA